MRLFDGNLRTSLARKGHSEQIFSFVNRSARPAMERVRSFLERCFGRWPSDRQHSMRQRIHNGDFVAAVFELVVHELLVCRGLAVEIEPQKEGTEKRPDFLVRAGGGSFYLECVTAREESPDQAAAGKRLAHLQDLLDKTPSPKFRLSMDVERMGPGQPSATEIRQFIETQLDLLEADAGSAGSPNTLRWERDGWRLVFHVFPGRTAAGSDKAGPAIGTWTTGVRRTNTAGSIRDSILKKVTRYGAMDRPYLVAANSLARDAEHDDFIDALTGDPAIVASQDGTITDVRNPNGVWRGAGGRQNTRLSAVLCFANLQAWSLCPQDVEPLVVHNPFARFPFSTGVLGLREWSWPDGRLHRAAGEPLHDILGLDRNWPADVASS